MKANKAKTVERISKRERLFNNNNGNKLKDHEFAV